MSRSSLRRLCTGPGRPDQTVGGLGDEGGDGEMVSSQEEWVSYVS